MAGITLRTARQVVPMIYAYTTPEIARHNGWTKIGDVYKRQLLPAPAYERFVAKRSSADVK